MTAASSPPPRPTRLPLLAVFAACYAPLLANGWYNEFIIRRPALYWAVELTTWLALPAGALALIFLCGWARPAELGFRARLGKNLPWPWLLAALLAVPALMLALNPYFVDVADRGKDLWPASFRGYRLQTANPWLQLLFTLYLALSAGLVEEPLFRGLLRRLFANTAAGAAGFVAVSTLLFAGVHWENGGWGLIYSALWGLFFALAYLALRNLWPLILGHIAVDVVMFGERIPAQLKRAWGSWFAG